MHRVLLPNINFLVHRFYQPPPNHLTTQFMII